jgi:uncharacterized protein (TIGR02646 family)
MVEIGHNSLPPRGLVALANTSPRPRWETMNSDLKQEIRSSLNKEQAGLCAYCERRLPENQGRIDHIVPQSKDESLIYEYKNLCHSCSGYYGDGKTPGMRGPYSCDQIKGEASLDFLEPRQDVNRHIAINIDTGELFCSLDREDPKHLPTERILNDTLGLNNSWLCESRKDSINALVKMLAIDANPADLIQPQDDFYWTVKQYFRI